MAPDTPVCTLCGEPMPSGEEMFKYHGYSGPCPTPPLPKIGEAPDIRKALRLAVEAGEFLSVILHELEESGVSLTASQDRRWAKITADLLSARAALEGK